MNGAVEVAFVDSEGEAKGHCVLPIETILLTKANLASSVNCLHLPPHRQQCYQNLFFIKCFYSYNIYYFMLYPRYVYRVKCLLIQPRMICS